MTPDKRKDIREGDRFQVELEVAAVKDITGEVQVFIGDGRRTYAVWFPRSALLAGRRIARPLAIGDWVKIAASIPACHGWEGEIVAIKGNHAFIEWGVPDERRAKWLLTVLERANPGETT